MSTLFHGFLQAAGRGVEFVCRPLMRHIDARVERLLVERLDAELEARLVPTLSATLDATAQTIKRLDALIVQTNRSTRETDETLNTLLDEVNRLREHVETMTQSFANHLPGADGDSRTELAIVDHDGSCDGFENEPVGERARVG